MKRISKQNGVAGIIFIAFLPLLLMTFAFSVGYSQRLLAHAKLEEATEVSSLALIASPKETNIKDKEYAQKLVDLYITDNINEVEVGITTTKCEYKDGCVQASGELLPFTDFMVSATTEHSSWITHEDIGLGSEFKVSGNSATRKFIPQPVDIYFILDTSQSMSNSWNGKTQMQVVKETITRVVNDLEKFKTEEKSRVALLTYNAFNVKYNSSTNKTELYSYRKIDKYTHRTPNQVVKNLFEKPKRIEGYTYDYLYNRSQDIPLTENYAEFLSILNSNKVLPADGGGTESWQGLIAAAKEANNAALINPEQVFIFLSDGADSQVVIRDGIKYKRYLKKLVTEFGICKKLRNKIIAKKNRFQKDQFTLSDVPTRIKMGVIGINYQVNKNDGFGDCVGKENIYHAEQGEDVYKYILNLINEETGRLKY